MTGVGTCNNVESLRPVVIMSPRIVLVMVKNERLKRKLENTKLIAKMTH